MTAPWWGRDASVRAVPLLSRASPGALAVPVLLPAGRDARAAELSARVAGFTWDWTSASPSDAGRALIDVVAEQLALVTHRLNRTPDKYAVDLLRAAGIDALPAAPAAALLELRAVNGADRAPLVARGAQLGAPSTADGELIAFETERDLYVAPAVIAELYVRDRSLLISTPVPAEPSGPPMSPFGRRASARQALLIGLSGHLGGAPVVSLGVFVAPTDGGPTPVVAGGVVPAAPGPRPQLAFEALVDGRFAPLELVREESRNLTQTGVVEFRPPARWLPDRPAGTGDGDALLWLQVRIAAGQYATAPALSLLRLNVVRAVAARTLRDDVLESVPGTRNRVWRLTERPVLANSLRLEVDEGLSTGATAWREVSDLSAYGPEARVYTLNLARGEVSFGDGEHGAPIPSGFRHVVAARYQVGGGAHTSVAAGEIATPLRSAPLVGEVANPLPATGGRDVESRARALARGAETLRARGRAVTPADYALLAREAPGAQIARAHAVPGLHPAYRGRRLPGVVGVFVVPPAQDVGAPRGGPPQPDQATLDAVAGHLARTVGPAGVQVVCAAPSYQIVRAEVRLDIDPGADAGAVVRGVLDVLDDHFSPMPADSRPGRPFGAPIRYTDVLRAVLSVSGVAGVVRLTLILDGRRLPPCTDQTIDDDALLWPGGHDVMPAVDAGAGGAR